ncbi:hypothetical protein BC835DRAFT_865500 [Cytidiella melzeri]|nr:hypothetical protein BC835DRAFT_865500 [Cytidiella melzeri]
MGSPPLVASPCGGSQKKSARNYTSRKTSPGRRNLPGYPQHCKFDLEGTCPRGDDCSYIHRSQPVLVFAHPYTSNVYPHFGPSMAPPLPQDAAMQNSPPAHDALYYPMPVAPPSTPNMSEDIDHALHALSLSDRQSRQRQGHTKHAFRYRTKPCRFFRDTGRCAKGDRCNFIHDLSLMPSTTETDTESSAGLLDSASESEHYPLVSSSRHEWQDQVGQRSNPAPEGAKEHRNYYPITWRVIGGGVMMSGAREICQDYMAGACNEGVDCKFSHPAAADDQDPVAVSELPTSPFYVPSLFPTSPLQSMPIPIFLQPPPRRLPRRGSSRSQNRRTIRSQRKEERVLSGSTLLPTTPSEDCAVEATANQEDLTSPSQQSTQFITARSIVRPASTPPSHATSFAKILRIFQAESPQ